MNDINASASLDAAAVIQGLRQLRSELDSTTLSVKRLNDQGQKTGRTFKENFRDGAQVAGKAGGPIGSWSSKLLGGGANEDSLFRRMALGVSLVTLGVRAFQSVVDAALDRVRLFVEASRRVRAENEQAEKASESLARKGEAQAAGRMGAIAAGGRAAADDIDMVTSTGTATADQANRGVSSLYGRFGNTTRARKAVDIAMRGSMGGLDFDHVADALTKMGPAIENNDAVDRMLGRMSQQQTGRVGDPAAIWRERMQNIAADPFLMKAREQQAARSAIPVYERDAFMQSSIGNDDAAAAKDPLSKIQVESAKKMNEVIDELRKSAEAQGKFFGFFADVFQPNGSFETQLRRAMVAEAKARGVEPPPPPGLNVNQTFPTGPYDPRAFGPFGR